MNEQPTEKQVAHSQGYIDVQGEVWETLQGEGPFAGRPAVFVRTAGCNLSANCKLCDTDYTSKRRHVSPHILLAEIKALRPSGLVVITGGEPFRQELGGLVRLLLSCQYEVQIETNGTLCDDSILYLDYDRLTIVCSPKTGTINKELQPHITALKYILRDRHVDPDDGLPTDSLGGDCKPCRPWEGFKGTVYCQPVDEQDEQLNKKNLAAAMKSCFKYGYTLSYQLHKLLGLA